MTTYNPTTIDPDAEILQARRNARRMLSTAPMPERIRSTALHLAVIGGLLGLVTLVLVTLVAFRIFELALPIGFGPGFAVGMAVLIALVFIGGVVLIVHWSSRGNLLGERLEAFTGAVAGVEAKDAGLVDEGRDQIRAAQLEGVEARQLHDRADDVMTNSFALALEGVQAAARILRVDTITPPDVSQLLPRQRKLRSATEVMLTSGDARTADLTTALQARVLPRLRRPSNPHDEQHERWLGHVDIDEVDPTALPYTPVKQTRPRRVGLWFAAGAVAVALVAGILIVVLGHGLGL